MSEIASTPQIRGKNPYHAARQRRKRGAYREQSVTQADMFVNPENATIMQEALALQPAPAPLLPPETVPRPPQPEMELIINLGERLKKVRQETPVYDSEVA